jgi:anti-sigma factor RsiW
MSAIPISNADLHAYVDGELPQSRHAEIDAWLAEHPEDVARVEAYRAQKQGLRQLFDPVLDEPLPDALRELAYPPATAEVPEVPLRRRYLASWSLPRIAASLALAFVSGVAGWMAHDHYSPPAMVAHAIPLPRQAAIAHVVFSPDVKRPVEIGAEHEDQLITWLSRRLGSTVRPPKLGALGYELIGGRLLPGNSGPVAQFMYHDASGQRLTLYVSTENTGNRDTAFRFAQEGPVNVFYWIDGRFGYAISAGIAKDELARVATAVYDQLETE